MKERKDAMKRFLSLVLILALAVSLLCAAAHAEEVPEPEGGKKFGTNWAVFGMTVYVNYEEEGYRVYIRSSDPAGKKGEEWEYSCVYNEEKDALISVSSSKNGWTADPKTGGVLRGENEYQGFDAEDQETVFTVGGNGRLIWEDGRGQAGADLEFTDIGTFEGFWCSGDGRTWAEISWSDSELDDNYGYNVYLFEGDDERSVEYSLHGLYSPETGKLTVSGRGFVYVRNADGGYDFEELPADPEPAATFSHPEGGIILLEREPAVELIYDPLGGNSVG